MKSEVTKTIVNGVEEYQYKGLRIDKETWESADCPMCCEKITDEGMSNIIVNLHNMLTTYYGDKMTERYIKSINNNSSEMLEEDFEEMNNFRWTEEELLFSDFGGEYYEDIEY